jgi:hypothetical protein
LTNIALNNHLISIKFPDFDEIYISLTNAIIENESFADFGRFTVTLRLKKASIVDWAPNSFQISYEMPEKRLTSSDKEMNQISETAFVASSVISDAVEKSTLQPMYLDSNSLKDGIEWTDDLLNASNITCGLLNPGIVFFSSLIR